MFCVFLAEEQVEGQGFYLSHPYLDGGVGLALVLSLLFTFLSNLPISLPPNHRSVGQNHQEMMS